MCLSVAVQRPNDVLATGEHLGFEWAVVHNGIGNRCGYVRVPKDHPWYGMTDFDLGHLDIHGGITFAEKDTPCGKGDDEGYWVGFDCCHSGDRPDHALCPPSSSLVRLAYGMVRSQEYVESECRRLCEQASDAE